MLELTTRFEGITTGARPGRARLSAKQAAQKAIANLRYIARPTAVRPSDTFALNLGPEEDPKAQQCVMRHALRLRAEKGGRKGIRVAEKLMCSLPNDFAGEPAREAVRLIAKRLAAGSPDVKIYAAIHTDRPNNLHAHFLVIDGLETREQARKRVGSNAKRVRPRSVVRVNERGRPKELRRMFADAINEVAELRGLTHVEFRSYQSRGRTGKPGSHRGTKASFRSKVMTREFLQGVLLSPIDDLFQDAKQRAEKDVIDELELHISNLRIYSARENRRGRRAATRF